MLAVTLTSNSKALWYMTRGFGIMALVLLTMTLVLGLTEAVRYARPGWPRFVISALHRNASLLAVVAIAIHVVTAVLDSYAPIYLVDVFVPLVASYRPIWLGLGALSLDVLIAVMITSLVRERLGHNAWKVVHWTAYACWPLAVVHGLGTGTDTRLGWVLFLYAACTFAVLAALWWRLARGLTPANSAGRSLAALASIALPIVVAVWVTTGPLRPGWAKKAGTPANLLSSTTHVTNAPESKTTP